MSGHNKWSKIKHKKASSDVERSKLFSKHARFISMESRKAHGHLAAPGLLAAIERARKDSMPKDKIDRAVAKGAGVESSNLAEVLFETFGPGGVAMLITAVTDNTNRTSQEIKHLLAKSGYQLGSPGTATWAFTKSADGYKPNLHNSLSEDDGSKLAELILLLEDQDDVQDIYTTADE